MKIGIITQANEKGQIVIPKQYRDALGINNGNRALNLVLRGSGIYIYPVVGVLSEVKDEDSYTKILEITKGKWRDEDWNRWPRLVL